MDSSIRVINNHLVLPANNPGKLRAVFPDVKEAVIDGRTYCALPHTLDVVRVLNNVGMKVPSPIRTQYDWSGNFKPRWYQIDTAEFFTLNNRCHCHNSMRTGKTLSALWASDYLRKLGEVNRVLIVAPLSTLWDVWEQNIFEHFPMRTFTVLHGSREKRLELLAKPFNYYIINHHGVKIIEKELRKRTDIGLVIVDEVAEFFNCKTTTMWKPLNEVLNKQGIRRRVWGMTGTPTPEGRPTDAFGQCKLVTPNNYQSHFTAFKRETMLQVNTFRWVPRRGSEQTVHRILQPSIRFDRTVCSAMEPCLIERRAELSVEQTKHYKELLRSASTEIQGTAVTAVNAAVLISKLTQTVCGCVYGANGEVIKLDFGPRLAVLRELIAQNNEKVVVFAPFTGVLHALADELRPKENRPGWSVAVMEGATTMKVRNETLRNFRAAKDPHVIVAHPQCMAHGLDLTAASLIIWYAPIYANKIYEQACARIDGSKQTAKIDIAHIYACPEERKIYNALRDKKKMQDVVLNLIKGV